MKKRFINSTILLFFLFTIQIIWYGLFVAHLVANPAVFKSSSYSTIYPAGYIARYQGFSHTYDLNLQQHVQETVVYPASLTRFYPYNHPPFLLPILWLVTTSNYITSFFRWISVLAVFHLASLLLLARLLCQRGWQRKEVWLVAVSGLLFYPIYVAYLKGQDSAFTLFGVALWAYGLLMKKDKAAGLGLVLAAMRPQITLVLAIPFLFKRQKVWWWFLGWGLIFLLYFYLLIGLQGLKDFVQVLFLSGEGRGYNVDKMYTLMGMIVRTFPTISTQRLHIIGYSAFGLSILFLCFVWLKSHEIGFNQIGLAVLLSIVFSPHLHMHDLSLLLVPAIGAAAILVEKGILSQRKAAVLIPSVSMVFAINGVFLSYTIIYLVIFVLGLLLWVPSRWKALQLRKADC